MEDKKLTRSISNKRFWLSIIIIVISLAILLLSVLCNDELDRDIAFPAIIGLIGTWVGTVLAFYFTKENFDAASASTQKLIDSITTKDKLNSTKAGDVMIPFSKISFLTREKGKEYLLKDINKQYLEKNNRLPILNPDKTIYGIAHKSIIVEFIADQSLLGNNTSELSLEDLISSKYKEIILKGFSTIREDDSLDTAKILMEKFSVGDIICSDIFVTEDGTKETNVIGWITNAEIAKHSVV